MSLRTPASILANSERLLNRSLFHHWIQGVWGVGSEIRLVKSESVCLNSKVDGVMNTLDSDCSAAALVCYSPFLHWTWGQEPIAWGNSEWTCYLPQHPMQCKCIITADKLGQKCNLNIIPLKIVFKPVTQCLKPSRKLIYHFWWEGKKLFNIMLVFNCCFIQGEHIYTNKYINMSTPPPHTE